MGWDALSGLEWVVSLDAQGVALGCLGAPLRGDAG